VSVLQISERGVEVLCDMNYDKYGGRVLCEIRGEELPSLSLVKEIIDRPGLEVEESEEALRLSIPIDVFERGETPGEIASEVLQAILCIRKLAKILGLNPRDLTARANVSKA